MDRSDIHSIRVARVKQVREVDKDHNPRQFFKLTNLTVDPDADYRLLRNRNASGAMRNDTWAIVECKAWDKDCLHTVKDAVVADGFAGNKLLWTPSRKMIRVYIPEELEIVKCQPVLVPGFYFVKILDGYLEDDGTPYSGSNPVIVLPR